MMGEEKFNKANFWSDHKESVFRLLRARFVWANLNVSHLSKHLPSFDDVLNMFSKCILWVGFYSIKFNLKSIIMRENLLQLRSMRVYEFCSIRVNTCKIQRRDKFSLILFTQFMWLFYSNVEESYKNALNWQFEKNYKKHIELVIFKISMSDQRKNI